MLTFCAKGFGRRLSSGRSNKNRRQALSWAIATTPASTESHLVQPHSEAETTHKFIPRQVQKRKPEDLQINSVALTLWQTFAWVKTRSPPRSVFLMLPGHTVRASPVGPCPILRCFHLWSRGHVPSLPTTSGSLWQTKACTQSTYGFVRTSPSVRAKTISKH